MRRTVIKQLTGSKADQAEELPLAYFKEPAIGRAPSRIIRRNAEKDDLVSHQRARIAHRTHDSTQFTITNHGINVKKYCIASPARIKHGILIQSWPDRPEVILDLNSIKLRGVERTERTEKRNRLKGPRGVLPFFSACSVLSVFSVISLLAFSIA